MYSCDVKFDFQHHYSSLQCHMIFRNHSNMLICCSRNISDYYQCWKQLCCFIFLWNINYSKCKSKLHETESVLHIVWNVMQDSGLSEEPSRLVSGEQIPHTHAAQRRKRFRNGMFLNCHVSVAALPFTLLVPSENNFLLINNLFNLSQNRFFKSVNLIKYIFFYFFGKMMTYYSCS